MNYSIISITLQKDNGKSWREKSGCRNRKGNGDLIQKHNSVNGPRGLRRGDSAVFFFIKSSLNASINAKDTGDFYVEYIEYHKNQHKKHRI